jgi:hypothetical protein
MNEWLYMGMKQIADRHGFPYVFELARCGDGLWLNDDWAKPGSEWDPINKFAFCLRKSKT